jgi:hypothetical protein
MLLQNKDIKSNLNERNVKLFNKHRCSRIYFRGFEGKSHNISYPSRFIEVHVPSQKRKRSCICVLEILNLARSTIFLLGFGAVLTFYLKLI